MKKENMNRYALIVRAAGIDVDVARCLAEPLLEARDPDVHWYLGYLCLCGLFESLDRSKARQWFQKAAALGSALGESALAALDALPSGDSDSGCLVVDANGVTRIFKGWPDIVPCFRDGSSPCSAEDCGRVYQWYVEAANEGDPKMQLLVGMLYENGIHVPPNAQTALDWYKRAYKGGLHEAKVWHSRLSIRQEYQEKHRKWREERSALTEYIFETSRRKLGPGPMGEKSAFQWCLSLAEKGNPDAQIEVSRRYGIGSGVKENRLQEYLWLLVGSEGHPDAFVRMILRQRLESRTRISREEIRRAREIAKEYQIKWSKSENVVAQHVA